MLFRSDALRLADAVFEGRRVDGYEPPSHASPPRRIPQFVGARGEQLNRLASRTADGVFLSGFLPDALGPVVAQAHAHRPIDLAVYVSVRFSSRADPWSITATPQEAADVLARLVATHRPASIGIALVDGRPLDLMIEDALSTFDVLRGLLG